MCQYVHMCVSMYTFNYVCVGVCTCEYVCVLIFKYMCV